MSRKLAAGLAAGLTATLFASWFVLNRKVDRLDAALARELERVEKLDSLLNDANTRVDEGYRRIEEARIRRLSALRTIEEANAVVSAAAEQRAQADSMTAEARALESAALEQAAEARRLEEAERRRREEEWSRLGRALGGIGPTRRDDHTLTAELDPGLPQDKEKISRLAGILLAHHGYRAVIEGAGAEAVETYLVQAGLPADILKRGAATGRLQLVLRDEILGTAP